MRYDVASIIEVLKGKDRIATLTLDESNKRKFYFHHWVQHHSYWKSHENGSLAQLNDGKIDLIIVRKTSRINLLKLFPKLFSGDHIKSPLVEYRQVQNFSISLEETNDLTIDGEIIGTTPLNVQMSLKW